MSPSPAPRDVDRTGAVSTPPTGNDRLVKLGLLGLWIFVMIAVPLRYYVPGSDTYDERFSWRMFSAVRVQQCTVDVREVVRGSERPVDLMRVLPAPWVSLIQRNRPAVLRRFLLWRCGSDASPSAVSITHTCRDASGTELPPFHRSLDCETFAYEWEAPEGSE